MKNICCDKNEGEISEISKFLNQNKNKNKNQKSK